MKIYNLSLSETTRRAMITGIYERAKSLQGLLDYCIRHNKKPKNTTLDDIENELLTLQTEVKKLL